MTHLIVGIITEGTTDYRFLEPIIEKTIIEFAYNLQGQFDLYIRNINCDKGDSFTDFVINAAKIGHEELGINLLIVHTDADSLNKDDAYNFKINVANQVIKSLNENNYCKNIVPLVPIFETESWMLADKTALIEAIGTSKTEIELKINGHPESFVNPKERIEEAIIIGRSDMPKKIKNALKINDLYSFIGQKLNIENLKNFKSYNDFLNNLESAFNYLNLISK